MFGFHGSSHDGIDIALSCFASQEPQACQLGEMGSSAVLAIGPVRVLITTHTT
jgi:hypothetical protein